MAKKRVLSEEHLAKLAAGRRAVPSESQDSYPRVVVALDNKVRIIRCKDNIQYVTQVRSGELWKGSSYFATLKGAEIQDLRVREHAINLFRNENGQAEG